MRLGGGSTRFIAEAMLAGAAKCPCQRAVPGRCKLCVQTAILWSNLQIRRDFGHHKILWQFGLEKRKITRPRIRYHRLSIEA